MSFSNLPGGAVGLGLFALAAGLYALQRLRVRHRERIVPTTLFWKEALEETRARVLVRRFRHPWAYLLVLLVASLLWLAFAEPRADSDAGGHEHVFLLDGSAGMAWGTRFQDAVRALEEHAGRVPATVVFCGARPRTLLKKGENALLLRPRLEGLEPEACPATVERVVRELKLEGSGTLAVFGDAPLRDGVAPEAWEIRRPGRAAERPPNRGITALGVTEAASGAWNRVDVSVEAGGAFEATLGGVPQPGLRDLPARGQLLKVRLEGADAIALDDEASIRLPSRPLVRVFLAGHEVLRPVLEADPGIVVTGPASSDRRDADVVIGEDLVLVPAGRQEHAFLVEGESSVARAFESLGLDAIDATGLAQAAQRPITLGARDAPARRISVWAGLFTGRFNFIRSRAFPIFVARAVRWLAGVEDFLPYAAAGEPVARAAAFSGLDPVGTDFTPPAAGTYAGTEPLAVSLLDRLEPFDRGADAQDGALEGDAPAGFDLFGWLALVALALLLAEWHLHATGRVP